MPQYVRIPMVAPHDFAFTFTNEVNTRMYLYPTSRSAQDGSQIFVEIFSRVFVVNFDLEDAQTVHPCDESRQRRFSGSTDTDQEKMSLRLTENPVDSQDVIEHFVEQHQRNVQLFFVKHLQRRRWRLETNESGGLLELFCCEFNESNRIWLQK